MVLRYWYPKRHHNWQVPELVFFDAQAHMGTDANQFPESSVGTPHEGEPRSLPQHTPTQVQAVRPRRDSTDSLERDEETHPESALEWRIR